MALYFIVTNSMTNLLLLMTIVLAFDSYENPFRIGKEIGTYDSNCQTDDDCVETLGQRWRCLGQTCHFKVNTRKHDQTPGT